MTDIHKSETDVVVGAAEQQASDAVSSKQMARTAASKWCGQQQASGADISKQVARLAEHVLCSQQ
jgi:hypothetical protein